MKVQALPILDSTMNMKFFYNDIIYQFRIPNVVRIDKGMEYKSHFTCYYRSLGIVEHSITMFNPRANGHIECIDGRSKCSLCKYVVASQNSAG